MRAVTTRGDAHDVERSHDAPSMRTIVRCTDNAHDALAMHAARAIRACLARRRLGARPHRQLKMLLARGKWECILL
jgi:hypothetical protein